MGSRYTEVPIDGPLSDEQVAALERSNLDVDALFSIAVDGPYSPNELVTLAQVDVSQLASAIHSVPIDGPLDPSAVVELSRLPASAFERVRSEIVDGPLDADELLRRVRASA